MSTILVLKGQSDTGHDTYTAKCADCGESYAFLTEKAVRVFGKRMAMEHACQDDESARLRHAELYNV